MIEDEMIQYLQDRFDLSKDKATMIYFKLQDHFETKLKGNIKNFS